ncbi:hypothetical protein [Pseudofrankia inefficax]|uniref:Uncharacterized protein n=1 Tax=Pseudofrankia inefficax (strain DSM 45817 / CECT 9037 / DDB 130130 / EuI1c) TaxID=298654 RepID=E3JCW0_PSEI1|nr:hypothetical protein [Pseudofrankia inefficax]ADP79950.1 hypothetical protein FraEuI1c_1899 [Pseudofrankia inefficax]
MTIETTSTPTAVAGAPGDGGEAAQAGGTGPAGGAGSGPASRADAFRAEMATLRIRDPRGRLDGLLLRAGALLLVLGPVLGIIAYFLSHSTTNPLQQRDAIVLGTVGISVTVVGAALFVRYSLAAFLRFWLARILFDREHPPA